MKLPSGVLSRGLCHILLVVSMASWCAAGARAQALDILMDGPWIFYDGAKLNNVPVLIAMAPHAYGHGGPIFTTGDGIIGFSYDTFYCVAFRNACPYNTGNSALLNTPYSPFSLLQVQTAYPWPTMNPSVHAYYFILPMPDSASSDGVERMKFSDVPKTFPYNEEPVSIGLQLHYKNATATISVLDCATDSNCTTSSALGAQTNYGTLRLGFTNIDDPSDVMKCDHHVRMAHHQMMELLGSGIQQGALNTKHYYVDLRPYDDADCLDDDPQYGGQAMAVVPEFMKIKGLKEGLDTVLADCKALRDKKPEDEAGCGALQEFKDQHANGLAPVQSLELQERLVASISKLELLRLENLKLSAKKDSTRETLTAKLRHDEVLLRQFIAMSTTSGKDCRVGQAQIVP